MRLVSLLLLLWCISATLDSQTVPTAPTPVRDPQAIAIVNQTLTALGANTAAPVQDYSASGTITYHFWKDNNPEAPVTVKAKGLYEFSMEADLPQGKRTWVVNNGRGLLKEPDKQGETKQSKIPYHDAVSLGALTIPTARLSAALSDSTYSIQYQLATISGHTYHEISVQPTLPAKDDPAGSIARLEQMSFFIDPQTFSVIGVHNFTHPVKTQLVDIPQATYFSDYRLVSGLLVPFHIDELVAGQKLWSVQLTAINFNTGLTDADFPLQ